MEKDFEFERFFVTILYVILKMFLNDEIKFITFLFWNILLNK